MKKGINKIFIIAISLSMLLSFNSYALAEDEVLGENSYSQEEFVHKEQHVNETSNSNENDIFENDIEQQYTDTQIIEDYNVDNADDESNVYEDDNGLLTESDEKSEGVTYSLEDGVLTISGNGPMEDYDNIYDIPWNGGQETVDNVYEVVVEDGVTSIGKNAFCYCVNLSKVTISNSVTSIGESSFAYCISLTSINIPNSVTSIGDWVFHECDNLTSISIPNGVTSIGDFTFDSCDSLTNIIIPDSVMSIGEMAFSNCKNITSIAIPESVTSIGESAFQYCTSLTDIIIPDSVISIGGYAFVCCDSLKSITIPESVTSIGDNTFYGCSSLTSITIPNSVKSIGGNAFVECSSLKKVIISDLISYWEINFNNTGSYPTQYGAAVYINGELLTDIIIPDSFTSIPAYSFYGFSSLTSVTIPDSVTSIGEYAFRGCRSLWNVTIPDSVTSIEDGAFYGCSGLDSMTIPGSVRNIGSSAFRDCKKLTSITLPESVISIGEGAFYNCRSLTSITIPESITSIEDDTFSWCMSLQSITIPESVKRIGNWAFYLCENLKNVTIPEGVTSIGESAFRDCSSLTSITIPESIISIGDAAFYDCWSLKNVYYAGTREQWHSLNVDVGSAVVNCGINTVYTISFDPNGGEGEMPSQSFGGDEEKALSMNLFTRSDYVFAGWNTMADGSGNAYDDGEVVSNLSEVDGETVVLYAQWVSEESNQIEITKCVINGLENKVYIGKAIEQKLVISYSGYQLVENVDFEVRYTNNVSPGTATVTVTGIGNFYGTLTLEFNILKMPQTVTLSETEFTKTIGDDPFVISAETDGDGTFEYVSGDENVVKVDEEGKVSIVGAGTATISVYATETELYARSAAGKVNVTVEKKTQTVTVSKTSYTKTFGNAAFSLGAATNGDGTLKYSSSNTKVVTVSASGTVTIKAGGTATISIYADESANYKKSAVKKVTITVNKKSQTITASTTTFNKVVGSAAFALNVKTNGNGKLTYSSSNKTVATVSTTGKVTIKTPGKTVISIYAAETSTYKKSAVKKITVNVKPKATTLSTVTNTSDNKVKATWKKGTGITGYQIQYSVKSNFSKVKTVTVSSVSTVNRTVGSLTKGYTYYFRIRTYKTVGGIKYYSEWSAKKSVKISKGVTENLKAPSSCKFIEGNNEDNKIKWTKVEGATGYIVYYKKGENGTWTKLGTTSSLTYTDKNVKTGVYYFYRVKAYKIKEDGSTVYGKYKSTSVGQIWYYYPDFIIGYPSQYGSTMVFSYYVTNNGKKTIRLYSKGAVVVDKDYPEVFNASLTLIKGDSDEPISYLDIPPGKTVVAYFMTRDRKKSWYDEYTSVLCDAKYDGMNYVFRINEHDGASYMLNNN